MSCHLFPLLLHCLSHVAGSWVESWTALFSDKKAWPGGPGHRGAVAAGRGTSHRRPQGPFEGLTLRAGPTGQWRQTESSLLREPKHGSVLLPKGRRTQQDQGPLLATERCTPRGRPSLVHRPPTRRVPFTMAQLSRPFGPELLVQKTNNCSQCW